MRTERDLFTGATTYILDSDGVEFAELGKVPGSFKLICSADGVIQAIEALTRVPPVAVRRDAEALAAIAEWELNPAELRAVRDGSDVTFAFALSPDEVQAMRSDPIHSPSEAAAALQAALKAPTAQWRVTEVEVGA